MAQLEAVQSQLKQHNELSNKLATAVGQQASPNLPPSPLLAQQPQSPSGMLLESVPTSAPISTAVKPPRQSADRPTSGPRSPLHQRGLQIQPVIIGTGPECSPTVHSAQHAVTMTQTSIPAWALSPPASPCSGSLRAQTAPATMQAGALPSGACAPHPATLARVLSPYYKHSTSNSLSLKGAGGSAPTRPVSALPAGGSVSRGARMSGPARTSLQTAAHNSRTDGHAVGKKLQIVPTAWAVAGADEPEIADTAPLLSKQALPRLP
jgi:hypothetical protein